jgi:hypothetical protein
VWAHDMGTDQNAELLDYFNDRKVWLVEPDLAPVRLTEITRPDTRDHYVGESR